MMAMRATTPTPTPRPICAGRESPLLLVLGTEEVVAGMAEAVALVGEEEEEEKGELMDDGTAVVEAEEEVVVAPDMETLKKPD